MPNTSEFNLILGRPTTNSITASLYARADMQVVVAYGTATGNYTIQTSVINLQAYLPQNIELTGLTPNTAYYYHIIVNGTASGEHTFHTQRAPGSTFTFTIDADPHNRDPRFNGELYAATLTNALADHPDFHINLGDTFMTEKLKPQTYAEAESTFTDMRPYFGILGADAPLFLVNGNHEGELGWLLPQGNDLQLPIWSTRLRQLYYPNPEPNNFYAGSSTFDPYLGDIRDGYYAWTWGDALFIVLDPFWYTSQKPQPDDPNNNWNWTLGKEQYDWLKSTLENSTAKFKFVFIHHLVGGDKDARGGIEFAGFYEWGGKNADGTDGFNEQRPGWGAPIHQMLVDNHVNVVFHGHDHVFVKQELDGIIYQEVPQPSNTEYNKTSLATDYGYLSGDVFGSSGHLRVTVSPLEVTVEYVRAYLQEDENNTQRNAQVDFSYPIQ
ncbi:MAG TPA: metallophosphoesterase [Anaerolineaceae bacterium]|nr:metallophosphoesterase [Anaerolineaceae bacterium]